MTIVEFVVLFTIIICETIIRQNFVPVKVVSQKPP